MKLYISVSLKTRILYPVQYCTYCNLIFMSLPGSGKYGNEDRNFIIQKSRTHFSQNVIAKKKKKKKVVSPTR